MKVQALFKKASAPAKKATTTKKTAAKPAKKAAAPRRSSSSGEPGLWIPNTTRPGWLDGSLPGDRGFDPLGLSKPVEYLQVDIDQLDQNAAVNKRGGIIGTFTPVIDQVDNTAPLQPYSEVFGLARFRECELIHGRWAMLGALGVLISELDTGISWQDAIAIEYAHPSWFGLDVPFGINQLAVANSVLMGGVEVFRSQELDTEKRCYPGGAFDPFKLASNGDEVQAFRLKEAEMKHCRLAMLACLGFGIQALIKGTGALASLEAAF